MNNREDVTDTLTTHGFIAISILILIIGVAFAFSLISIVGNSVSFDSSYQWSAIIFIVIGIVCLGTTPFVFQILKSLRILEIAGDRLIVHSPIFDNYLDIPRELELSQITTISEDRMFKNLMHITFVEGGEKETVYSFLQKGKVDLFKEGISN